MDQDTLSLPSSVSVVTASTRWPRSFSIRQWVPVAGTAAAAPLAPVRTAAATLNEPVRAVPSFRLTLTWYVPRGLPAPPQKGTARRGRPATLVELLLHGSVAGPLMETVAAAAASSPTYEIHGVGAGQVVDGDRRDGVPHVVRDETGHVGVHAGVGAPLTAPAPGPGAASSPAMPNASTAATPTVTIRVMARNTVHPSWPS